MAEVFVLAGQSNMVGTGRMDSIPDAVRSRVSGILVHEAGGLRDILDSPSFGPEVGFAYEWLMRGRSRDIRLCKVARGGANLYYDWAPDVRQGGEEDAYRGPLYPVLLASVREALASAGGDRPVAACLWMQGERDSVFEFMAASYAANMGAFIGRLRQDLGVPALPFIMGQIAPRAMDAESLLPRHRFRDVVRTAQAETAARVPDVRLVGTLDLPQSDNLHFDSAGLIELGRRYAGAFFEMTEPVGA
jgi:iduronate 2-sulfatase